MLEGNSGSTGLVLLLVSAAVAALVSPLADADLPLHLRVGDVLRQLERFPVTEPIAWTRAGAPWFAYSWLPEWVYAVSWQAGGRTALSVLHALLMTASLLALRAVARRDGWSEWGTRLTLLLHLVLWGVVQPATRPQLLLAIAVPLSWSAALRLRDATAARERTAALLVAWASAVLAVNSHLLFPLTLAPVLLLLADRSRAPAGSVWRFGAATIAGWCCTPYVLRIPEIFALNFATNALFGRGAAIQEHEPGFRWFAHASPGLQLVTLFLLVLPLLPSTFRQHAGRLRWLTVGWVAGLALFALAVRGLLLWWLLVLPIVAAALGSIPLPRQRTTRRAVAFAWVLALLALPAQAWRSRAELRAQSNAELPLDHPAAAPLEAAVQWIACATGGLEHATAERGVRGATVFDFGSYLGWRVPAVSWSVDGRTIFPDSVARAEATQGAPGSQWHPPYRSADVVVLPASHVTGALLDADAAFVKVFLLDDSARDETKAAHLWVRRSWMDRAKPSSLSSGRDACGNRPQP